MRVMVFFSCALIALPAFGQTMYKCPPTIPGGTPVFQQMPCSPTGGGEAMEAKPIKSTGTTLEINEQGQEYMKSNKERWEAQTTGTQKPHESPATPAVEQPKSEPPAVQPAAQ